MWVDRYRPKTSKNIIGQQGDKSCAKKLAKWLRDWERNRSTSIPAGKESEMGADCRAALLSGPPGIGKTTTATIVCEVRIVLPPPHAPTHPVDIEVQSTCVFLMCVVWRCSCVM